MRKLPVVSVIANILLVGYILINLATTNSNNYQWKAEECLKGEPLETTMNPIWGILG